MNRPGAPAPAGKPGGAGNRWELGALRFSRAWKMNLPGQAPVRSRGGRCEPLGTTTLRLPLREAEGCRVAAAVLKNSRAGKPLGIVLSGFRGPLAPTVRGTPSDTGEDSWFESTGALLARG